MYLKINIHIFKNKYILYIKYKYIYIGDTAVIGCVSNDNLESGARINWYQETWTPGDRYILVISCLNYKDNGYECEHNHYETRLKINKAKPKDSGVYYCTYGFSRTFANGTFLIVEGKVFNINTVFCISWLQKG